MARRLPVIVSPVVPITVVGGREVLLLTVESWPDRVRVRLVVRQDEATDRLDAEYSLAVGSSSSRDWVEMPGAAFFKQIQFSLQDAVSTPYALDSGSVSGTGSEWEAEWQFRPGVPLGVSVIQVGAHTAEGEQSVSVDMGTAPVAENAEVPGH